ncbi:MAG TPA: hypothetical protein VGI39_34585 [Polyangiaceae bacterium]|jgi:hypothetical protein
MSARLWIFAGGFLAAPMASCATKTASVGGPCAQRGESDAYACAESQFWGALHQPNLGPRQAAEATLTAVLAAFPSSQDAAGASLMHFRLGTLRLAMALENAQKSYVEEAQDQILVEFDRAMALDAYGGVIAPWKDAMQIATAAALEDWTDAVPLAQAGFQNIALNPMGNTLSLSGTTIGFPLSTNVPQTTVSYLDQWQCSGVAWCTDNTSHAPFARPGLSYHFAEAYARVGDRTRASSYLEQAVASPDYVSWPYRSVVEAARADLDGFLGKFSKLGSDGSAFDTVYANQPYGCLFCHGAAADGGAP